MRAHKSKFFLISVAVLFLAAVLFRQLRKALPVLIPIAVHEGGHLLAAHRMGLRWRRFSISPDGVKLQPKSSLISYGAECVTALGGPLANLLTAFLGTKVPFFAPLVLPSLFLSVVNLLPIRNFDGGRILGCLICEAADERASRRILAVTSSVSVIALWLISAYFLLRYGFSLGLFVFSVSVFCKVFIKSE